MARHRFSLLHVLADKDPHPGTFAPAVFGSATMCMAVFADLGATLPVVANGLRLLREESPRALP